MASCPSVASRFGWFGLWARAVVGSEPAAGVLGSAAAAAAAAAATVAAAVAAAASLAPVLITDTGADQAGGGETSSSSSVATMPFVPPSAKASGTLLGTPLRGIVATSPVPSPPRVRLRHVSLGGPKAVESVTLGGGSLEHSRQWWGAQ